MKLRTSPCALRRLMTLPLSPACSWARPRAAWLPQRPSWSALRPGGGTWSSAWAAFSRRWRGHWALAQAAEEAGGGAQGGAPHHRAPCHATTASHHCAPHCRHLKVRQLRHLFRHYRTHILLIFRFIFLQVQVNIFTRIVIHALMFKKTQFPHSVQCCSSVFPLCLKHS